MHSDARFALVVRAGLLSVAHSATANLLNDVSFEVEPIGTSTSSGTTVGGLLTWHADGATTRGAENGIKLFAGSQMASNTAGGGSATPLIYGH